MSENISKVKSVSDWVVYKSLDDSKINTIVTEIVNELKYRQEYVPFWFVLVGKVLRASKFEEATKLVEDDLNIGIDKRLIKDKLVLFIASRYYDLVNNVEQKKESIVVLNISLSTSEIDQIKKEMEMTKVRDMELHIRAALQLYSLALSMSGGENSIFLRGKSKETVSGLWKN